MYFYFLILNFEDYDFDETGQKDLFLYSTFEPYSANRMFPCFDQPDIKAEF